MHSAHRNVGKFIRLDLQDSKCFINEDTGEVTGRRSESEWKVINKDTEAAELKLTFCRIRCRRSE